MVVQEHEELEAAKRRALAEAGLATGAGGSAGSSAAGSSAAGSSRGGGKGSGPKETSQFRLPTPGGKGGKGGKGVGGGKGGSKEGGSWELDEAARTAAGLIHTSYTY